MGDKPIYTVCPYEERRFSKVSERSYRLKPHAIHTRVTDRSDRERFSGYVHFCYFPSLSLYLFVYFLNYIYKCQYVLFILLFCFLFFLISDYYS